MLAAQIILLLLLMAVCCLAPGFFFVRRLRWSPLEKLTGSVALSLILLYCATFAIYLLRAPRFAYWLVTAACLVLAAVTLSDLRWLLASRQVLRALAGFGVLAAWSFAMLLLIRHYSGGGWTFDWLEHFHRTIFFLDRLPVETMIGPYQIPARPPMMNLLATFFLAQTSDRFELFSVTFLVLNLLAFLPCVLMLRLMARRGGGNLVVLVALFAFNPMFIQNATYTWTKLLTVFFVHVGLWFYLAGWRKSDPLRTISAFLSLTAGMLVHYSAGPYLVFLGLHYAGRVLFDPRGRWREFLTGTIAAAALLATWIGWSIATYGAAATFGSNTAVTSSAASEAAGHSALPRIEGNIIDTLVPHPIRGGLPLHWWDQESAAGYVRDYAFLVYQSNLIVAMGIVGGLAVLWLLIRWIVSRRRRTSGRGGRAFWLSFLAFSIIAGIAVVGVRDLFGLSHITLQPVVLLGLTFLAAHFTALSKPLRWGVIAGCVVDVALGVLLHVHLENRERGPGRESFWSTLTYDAGGIASTRLTELSFAARINWEAKQDRVLLAETLRALAARGDHPPAVRLHEELSLRLARRRAEDLTAWGGWWMRNGERFTFLGDHVARQAWLIRAVILSMVTTLLALLIAFAIRR
ncbi:MAG TPA: hypothetical protein VMT00_06875 [Thermoanaerobaculia bacterium]|nr:hypothetical protein [Thermoanaerobaculia bacterium]